ncbi:CHC2 zinc finger domain-containing protein [Paraburkholderia dioscoreae]|uniref:DNA primase n=1 Tax=Paraburkholderia dioscoreae TaxID=2604047 RepID=A0A5Q4ZW60_9BURK|nr:CHC2 zinc finger domain-containing protein [Paraburkholderia dioscoreae]VVD34563.1 DNA primase [Paraburkholderia dioscoreae]VVD34572.1 DNA primase [Paraburkholderia dioscoreae]
MARIPDAELERLKAEVSVEQLVRAHGIGLVKSGRDWRGRCPFHEDGTPSLVVTPSKNLWHCFGCGLGGGPVDWAMKANGISFRHAVELLREGIPALAAKAGERTTVRALESPVSVEVDDAALLDQVVDYYHQSLKSSPEALAYLEKRGIAAAVEPFRLGFANRTLGLRLPEKNRVAGEAIRTRLQRIGVIRESGHEHLNGCIVFGWRDEAGHVAGLYGRKIVENQARNLPKHLYLPGPHRGVFNADGVRGQREVIVCESVIDALTFWCAGCTNVTAAFGADGFTEDHLALFRAQGVERVIIAYDRDAAGDAGAQKLAQRLTVEGIGCYRVQFPHGLDANEYALKVTPAAKSLGVLVRRAQWLGNGAAPVREVVVPTPSLAAGSARAAKPVPVAGLAAEVAPLPRNAEPPTSLAAKEAVVLPASVEPAAPAFDIPCEVSGSEIVFALDPVRYRVRGFDARAKATAGVLKVNVLASVGERFHVDTFDLYHAKARANYIARAAAELRLTDDVVKADLGRVLLKLEMLQAAADAPAAGAQMRADEERAALELLRTPALLERIVTDFAACGVVGEETNKLIGYLAAVSRKLDTPLAVVVQSSSAAGKSSLMDAVLAFVPEEERIKYSAMTGQSLFYMGETNLKHKVLAICEEEGASRAAYALKLLQSDGELTIASTGKDAQTGNLVTQEYRVEGPVSIMLTTTAIEIDEELLNRCLILTVDEGREQTEAIHRLQRHKRTLDGLKLKAQKERVLSLHRNAQRLLKPLAVVNPYADQLTFQSERTRMRRDHEKYLTLIDTIALLHQYQREVKTVRHAGAELAYIEVTLADIEQANHLVHEVLGRSLDELPPVTRRVLEEIAQAVKAKPLPRASVRFSRREVREWTGLGDTPLRKHLERLVELEYLLTHRGQRGQSFEYELMYDGDGSDATHLAGLLDVTTIGSSPPGEGEFAPGSLCQNSPSAPPLLPVQNRADSGGERPCGDESGNEAELHIYGNKKPDVAVRTSYQREPM